MLSLKLAGKEGVRILCLGAHCDDIEIGCGGTILKLAAANSILEMKWIVFTSTAEREKEARQSAESFLHEVKEKEIVVNNFKDGFLFHHAEQVKNSFESLKAEFQPDIIFTHFRNDLHQDHRLLSDFTWNTYRDHLILEYEIPKYDGDLGNPNFFVAIEKPGVDTKIRYILKHYASQAVKPWFDQEVFQSLMRIRGMECASKTKYAEAFYVKKALM